jgi:hypothetical protein
MSAARVQEKILRVCGKHGILATRFVLAVSIAGQAVLLF